MTIPLDLLKKTCTDMIETILLALDKATRGTIYQVGAMPGLQTSRVASGTRSEGSDEIQWGLDDASDYDWPGKSWQQYRDQPNRPLEAMSWCVEKQRSWTADTPSEDARSVRKQLNGQVEDFHHMEPVVVRKTDFHKIQSGVVEYPVDYQGNRIWQESEYIVVGVIKIHFKPYCITRGDHSTRIIKQLSRTLGTELLSLSIRESLAQAQEQLARQRLESCNILAHELRNTLVKMGFAFSAVNAEISILRQQWEAEVEKALPASEKRQRIFGRLNEIARSGLQKLVGNADLSWLSLQLLEEQEELARLALMPQTGAHWLEYKIYPKWERLLKEGDIWNGHRDEVVSLLGIAKKAIWLGIDPDQATRVKHIPEELRDAWRRLAYHDFTTDKTIDLGEILKLLDHPALPIQHKHQSRKVLTSLKVLIDMIPEIEQKSNRIISSLRNGDAVESS
jgi:hypothetical protein